MRHTYINGTGCISAQRTFDSLFLEEAELNENDNTLSLQTPIYKDFISPVAIRRMAKGVKNGIVASALALKEANLITVDAIITGTGMGCIEDSEKFLNGILVNKEQFLTPTSFIQSTHNTVGAQIALGLQCKAYNLTYVNCAVSFESSLLDAMLKIDEHEAETVLIGGIDEMAAYTTSLLKLCGLIKKDGDAPFKVLDSKTSGVVSGEGATFFVLADKKQQSTYAEILDMEMVNRADVEKIESKIISFLKANSLEVGDIDAVVLGFNGDVDYDVYYKKLTESSFKNTPQVYYKHLSGEYNTASAFGLWVGAKIMKTQQIPDILKVNDLKRGEYKNILLYNQCKGIDHSFILISK